MDLKVREGRDYFSWWPWDLYPVEGVSLVYTLGDELGEEYSQAAQVAIYGVS